MDSHLVRGSGQRRPPHSEGFSQLHRTAPARRGWSCGHRDAVHISDRRPTPTHAWPPPTATTDYAGPRGPPGGHLGARSHLYLSARADPLTRIHGYRYLVLTGAQDEHDGGV